MKAKYKVIIVDDHKLFREGLKFVLSQIAGVEVIAEAGDGQEFLDKIDNYKPDIILMDISMPNLDGIQTTKLAMKKHPELKIIALSMFGDEEYYYKMIHAGVKGFVLKDAGSTDLDQAIHDVTNGDNYFSMELLRNVITTFDGNVSEQQKTANNQEYLSEFEVKILPLLCKGMSNMDIAERLDINETTVEECKLKLLQKTKTKNTINLVMHAIKNQMI